MKLQFFNKSQSLHSWDLRKSKRAVDIGNHQKAIIYFIKSQHTGKHKHGYSEDAFFFSALGNTPERPFDSKRLPTWPWQHVPMQKRRNTAMKNAAGPVLRQSVWRKETWSDFWLWWLPWRWPCRWPPAAPPRTTGLPHPVRAAPPTTCSRTPPPTTIKKKAPPAMAIQWKLKQWSATRLPVLQCI